MRPLITEPAEGCDPRYDAVERRDEVRVDGALREAEATVDALEVGRQVVTRQVRLEEDLERIDQ